MAIPAFTALPGTWIPLAGMTALFAAGTGLMLYSAHLRAKDISRRVQLVQPAAKQGNGIESGTGGPPDFQFKTEYQGLSIAEQEQVARMFHAFQVSPDKALFYFTIVRLMAVVISGALAYLAFAAKSWPLPLLLPVAVSITAWFIPLFPVKMGAKKRRHAVGVGLPDALELLAVCADAGMSLESALQRVAQELRDVQPALAAELSLTWAQICIFPNRDKALLNLADRIGLPSLRQVASALAQSMRYGTPLAQSLRVAASELRNSRLSEMEERAHRLPVLLTFPMMLLILPTIFLIVGGPVAIKILNIVSR
jgi:tight adherence protein C